MADDCEILEYPHTYTEGDEDPPIMFVLHDSVPVTDFNITLHLRRSDHSVVARSFIDLGGSKGKFQFAMGDLIAGRKQLAEVEFENKISGREQTSHKFYINVVKEIA